MKTTTQLANNAAGQIESSWEHDVFGNVQKALLGLTAIMAGGAMFKDLISQPADWSSEAEKMGKQLGVSSEQASTLKVALQQVAPLDTTAFDAQMKEKHHG
jgi:hypothetical protein